MRSRFVGQSLLAGLLLASLVGPAHAQAAQECGDPALAPEERRAACDTALGAVIAPDERARILIERAQVLRLQGDLDAARAAIADLDEAERLVISTTNRIRADLAVERAEINRAVGNLDAALQSAEEARRLAPDDADPLVIQSLVLFSRGDENGGASQLAQALAVEPNDIGALYIAARQARYVGDIAACVTHGTRALELAPQDTRLLGIRARCAAESGRAELALDDLRRIEELGAATGFVLSDAALAFLALERFEEAADAARGAIEMDPLLEDAHFDRITALMAMGAQEEAVKAFREFQETGLEDRIGLANNLAWELYLAGRYEDSLRIAEEWLAANPEPIDEPNHIANPQGYAKVLETAGHARAALGLVDEAVETFLLAVETNPKEVVPLYQERLVAQGFEAAFTAGDFETFTAQGFMAAPAEQDLMSALRACAASGEGCRLYEDIPRSGPLLSPSR